jgi:hypothetical protein
VIDKAGRQLIALRNGLSAAPPADLSVLNRMQTNRQARAVLGVDAAYLKRGYEAAANVNAIGSGIGTDAMRSLLDQTNRRAQQVYKTLPDDDAALSDLNHKKVVQVTQQTYENVSMVSSAADDLNRGLLGSLADVLSDQLPPWLRPSSGKGRDLALKIGIGVAVLVGLFVAGKLVHTIILGRSTALGAAEDAVMALANAQRRKRHARSVLSVS